MQPNNTEQQFKEPLNPLDIQKTKWYKSTPFIVILLLFVPLLGICFTFMWAKWTTFTKVMAMIGSTIILAIQTFVLLYIFLTVGLLLLLTGFVNFFTGPEPTITPQMSQSVEAFLKNQYGKNFNVSSIKKNAPVSFGERWSLTADAYPNDDKSLKVLVWWDAGGTALGGSKYHDNYLSTYWSKEDQPILKKELLEIFGIDSLPKYSSQVGGVTTGSEFQDITGRTIGLEEASSSHKDQVPYQVSVDVGEVANEKASISYNSKKLYQIIEYMRSRFGSRKDSIEYKYSTAGATYKCELRELSFLIVDNSEQLEGCWVRNPAEPKDLSVVPFKKTNLIGNTETKIKYQLQPGWTISESKAIAGSEGTYTIVTDKGNLKINIVIYGQGFGEGADNANNREATTSAWADSHVGTQNGVNRKSFNSQGFTATKDNIAYVRNDGSIRTINYIVIYKSFLVYVYSETQSPNVNEVNMEYAIYNFVVNLEPNAWNEIY